MVLLEAWAEVRSTMGRGVLLLGGMIGHHHLELFERLENPDLAGVHIAAGFMPEHEVSALFQSATGVIIPSREEGFGLPILHAFEGGAAPICSDIPALREVAGNAALYADPKKPSDFAKQIITLMKSQATQKQLVQKGHARLALFSWKHAADEIASEICTKALHCDQ